MEAQSKTTEPIVAVSESENKVYKGLQFWLKFFGVLAFIECGLLILFSLIFTLVTLGVGLIFVVPVLVPLTVLYFFFGRWLIRSAGAFGRLQSSVDYRADTLEGLTAIRNLAKTAGILAIIQISISLLSIFLGMLLIFSLGASISEEDFNFDLEIDEDGTSIDTEL